MAEGERLQIIRPLRADPAAFVARDTSLGAARLVVVERVTRASKTAEERAGTLRRARALASLRHPNIAGVREVIERGQEVLVVSDFIDGEWLAALMTLNPRPPLELTLRVVLDMLEGLVALHGLCDEHGDPMHLIHGAIGPDSVLVGANGLGTIVRAYRVPHAGTNQRYVAPEMRNGELGADVRTDIYGAGAILRDVVADAPSEKAWAEPLTEIAWRACSIQPDDRWPTAASMLAAVRRVVGTKPVSPGELTAFLRASFGTRMRARRSEIEGKNDGAPPSGDPISASEIEVVTTPAMPNYVHTLPPPMPARLSSPARAPVPKLAPMEPDLARRRAPDRPAARNASGGGTRRPRGTDLCRSECAHCSGCGRSSSPTSASSPPSASPCSTVGRCGRSGGPGGGTRSVPKAAADHSPRRSAP